MSMNKENENLKSKNSENKKTVENSIRRHIIFYGSVQGVGFRYHAYHKARSLGLTGWVRNLYDGTVEMEVQGTESLIDELIIHLDNQRFIRINAMDVKTIPPVSERDFYER